MYCKFCSLISIRYFNLSLFLINGSKCSINSNGMKSYRFWSRTKCFSASNEQLLFYRVRKKSFSRQTSVASIENTRPNNDDIVSRVNFRRFRVHEKFPHKFFARPSSRGRASCASNGFLSRVGKRRPEKSRKQEFHLFNTWRYTSVYI